MSATGHKNITYMDEARLYRICMAINGNVHQHYAPTLEEAFKIRDELRHERNRQRQPGSLHTKKREGVHDPSLPPGYSTTYRLTDSVRHGTVLREYITTTIYHKGVYMKGFSAAYGTLRTKQEALELIMDRRVAYCKEHNIPLD